ncbi:MAG: fumarate hydratase [Firmicutes bacterium]|nr:fumarate hydratase [Bacillota bacterium]
MREVKTAEITRVVAELCLRANRELPRGLYKALREAAEKEVSPIGREALRRLVENAELAAEEGLPVCQDTGMVVVFVELGQEVHLVGGSLAAAVDEGIRQGYRRGYLRASVVRDPLLRKNTGDNTPGVIHLNLVPGNRIRVIVAPKGFGSENMGGVTMLTPAQGAAGVIDFVVDTVRRAGANPCPPVIVGIGLGGTMEKAALLAKEALLRPIGAPNPAPPLAALEREILARLNDLGIGPQGLGGRYTAVAVHLLAYPTHIAGLPVAVNISCHACRYAEQVI